MTKEEFISELKKELFGFEDMEEILQDQEEFIREAMSSGRSEQEVVASLGSPKVFADALKLEYRVQKIKSAPTVKARYGEILRGFGILLATVPLHFLVLFILTTVIFSFVSTWFFTAGTVTVLGASGLLGALVFSFFVGILSPNFIFILTLSLGGFFAGLALFVLLYNFLKVLVQFFVSYFNWSKRVVQKGF